MKAKDLSLLIVDEDQCMRQLLASLVSERYRSVTAAAPEDVGKIALESFDLMIAPRSETNSPEEDAADSFIREKGRVTAAITTAIKNYEFRALNQRATKCVLNPFECVLLEVAIDRSESSLRMSKKINDCDI